MIPLGDRGLKLGSLDELFRFAQYMVDSGWCPKGFKASTVVIAVQMGAELGLSPMASIQNIACVNGRPSVWGDAQKAVVMNSPVFGDLDEWFEINVEAIDEKGVKRIAAQRIRGNPVEYTDDVTAWASAIRKGQPEGMRQYASFSVADAKKAGLWSKDSPWKTYPFRMLKFRARSYVLRDVFPDVLRGFMTAEEAMELSPVVEATATVVPPTGRAAIGNGIKSAAAIAPPAPARATAERTEADLQDLIDKIESQINAAKTVKELEVGPYKLMRQEEDFLGEWHGKLLDFLKQKKAELQPQPA